MANVAKAPCRRCHTCRSPPAYQQRTLVERHTDETHQLARLAGSRLARPIVRPCLSSLRPPYGRRKRNNERPRRTTNWPGKESLWRAGVSAFIVVVFHFSGQPPDHRERRRTALMPNTRSTSVLLCRSPLRATCARHNPLALPWRLAPPSIHPFIHSSGSFECERQHIKQLDCGQLLFVGARRHNGTDPSWRLFGRQRARALQVRPSLGHTCKYSASPRQVGVAVA